MQEITTETNPSIQRNPKNYKLHYSLIIAGITFLILLVAAGIRSTPGVLIVPLEDYFHWDRTVITFALAINLVLYGLCGPFSAALMERYGVRRITIFALIMLTIGTGLSTWMRTPWQLIVTWGLMVGIGTGFTSSVLGAIVANLWFKEHKGLVIGIFSASGAAGQLIFLPLLAKAVEINGWQMSIWITALTALFITILVFLFLRNQPLDLGLLPYGAKEADNVQIKTDLNPFTSALNGLKIGVKSMEFWLLSGSFFVCGASTNGLIGTHFIPAAMEKGYTEVTAAGFLAVIGIFNIIGTTISGWLSDRYDNRWLLFWYYGLRGLSLLFLPQALGSSNLSLGIFIFFYGLDWIATVPPTVRLSAEVFGQDGGIVFGWIFAVHQLGAAAAAFGGGALHTWMGNYQSTFIISGVLCLLASGLVMKIRHTAPAKI